MQENRSDNTLNTARVVKFQSSSTQTLKDFVGKGDRNDFHRFKLTGRSSFNLVLKGLQANADVQLGQDRNRNGKLDTQETISRSTRQGTRSERIETTLDRGTYFIRVFPGSRSADTNYTLNLTATQLTPTSNTSQSQVFRDPVDGKQQWKTTVFRWDASQGDQPPNNVFAGNLNNPQAIGQINLGSNVRSDGKNGINFNWGMGAANGDANRLPVDYFAVRATTQVEFDGTSHLFRVNGDDGFQILAKHKGTNEQYFITPEKQWIQAFDAPYEVEYTLPAGQYDLTFNYYEATEAANLDFSWQKSAIQPDPISSSPSPNPTSSNQSSSPFPSPSPAPSDKPSSSQMGSSLWDNPLYYYPLTSKYGQRTYWNGSQWVSGFHRGIDIGTGDETPAVEAARKGTVTEAAIGWNGGYGNLVTIDHGDGLETRYAHLSSIAVKVGDRVDTSTVIGSVGSTGNSTGNHLHFEIRVDGEDKNPEEFISFA